MENLSLIVGGPIFSVFSLVRRWEIYVGSSCFQDEFAVMFVSSKYMESYFTYLNARVFYSGVVSFMFWFS